MYQRLALLFLLVALSAGCASDHGRIVGPGADAEIGDALREGDLREVVVVHGGHAYWVGADALRSETVGLIGRARLRAADRLRRGRAWPVTDKPHLTLRGVAADDVLVFRHPTSFIESGIEIQRRADGL